MNLVMFIAAICWFLEGYLVLKERKLCWQYGLGICCYAVIFGVRFYVSVGGSSLGKQESSDNKCEDNLNNISEEKLDQDLISRDESTQNNKLLSKTHDINDGDGDVIEILSKTSKKKHDDDSERFCTEKNVNLKSDSKDTKDTTSIGSGMEISTSGIDESEGGTSRNIVHAVAKRVSLHHDSDEKLNPGE